MATIQRDELRKNGNASNGKAMNGTSTAKIQVCAGGDATSTKLSKFLSPLNSNSNTPDKPSGCTWHKHKGDFTASPHRAVSSPRNHKILPNILHAIGHTPLVKLNNIPKTEGLKCEVLVKCEFFNPGGSVKDRVAQRIVEDAELAGILKPGSTIIEPTSGNTGIGLAMAAAVKGYRCIIVLSEKMSSEKVDVLKALGAEIVRTPVSADSNSPEGIFGVSYRLKTEIPNSVILDQYSNPGNPLAHYDRTAEEILEQCDGKLDMIVLTTGTGGTMTGIGRKIKEKSPNTIVVGVDPEGSSLAQPESLNTSDVSFYEVEGIGYDFIPTVLDRSVVDKWVKTKDKESLTMARRLIKEEGLLIGGSSGAAMVGAVNSAKSLKEGQRVVVLLPDGIRNYITKFISDQWMEVRSFKSAENTQGHWWWDHKVTDIAFEPLTVASLTTTCIKGLNLMKKRGFDQIPVVNNDGTVAGVVTMQNLMNMLIAKKIQPSDEITKSMDRIYPKVTDLECLGVVSRTLEKQSFVLVVDSKTKPLGIISAVDLLEYISKEEQK